MRKLVFVPLAILLLFCGCINIGGNPPAENQTPANATQPPVVAPNQTGNVTIIIEQQENQTVTQNYTAPPPPAESTEMNYTFKPDEPFAIYFIYVGDVENKLQGDAVLIRKGDFEVLVDAGPAQTSGRVIDFLRSRGVDDVDVLLSTAADPMRYGGITPVSSAFRVEELWWQGKDFGDKDYASAVSGISTKVKHVRTVGRGFNASIDGMKFTVLNPNPSKTFNDVNNDAVVLRVEDRNFSMVLLSNVEYGAQSDLLNNQKALMLRPQVMEAPYYGLGKGTSGISNFLKTLRPQNVVMSGGPDESPQSGGSRDPFRQVLFDDRIPYYENYVGGTVRVASDGNTYSVQYFTQ